MQGNKKAGDSNIMSAGEFVKAKPFLCFHAQDVLYDIISSMTETHVYAAAVLERNHLLGLLTEHHILLCLLSYLSQVGRRADRLSHVFKTLQAEDVMIRRPLCIEAETCLNDCAHIVAESGFRYMPVVWRGHPVGILSRDDIIKFKEEEYRHALEDKEVMLSYLMHHENYGCV